MDIYENLAFGAPFIVEYSGLYLVRQNRGRFLFLDGEVCNTVKFLEDKNFPPKKLFILKLGPCPIVT